MVKINCVNCQKNGDWLKHTPPFIFGSDIYCKVQYGGNLDNPSDKSKLIDGKWFAFCDDCIKEYLSCWVCGDNLLTESACINKRACSTKQDLCCYRHNFFEEYDKHRASCRTCQSHHESAEEAHDREMGAVNCNRCSKKIHKKRGAVEEKGSGKWYCNFGDCKAERERERAKVLQKHNHLYFNLFVIPLNTSLRKILSW